MKKHYAKPNVELVDFSLSSSIASGCSNIYEDDGLSFTESCAIVVEGIDGVDFCYHNPQDSSSLFTS